MSKIICLFLLYVAFSFSSCSPKEEVEEINISVTLPPFADIVKQIVGNKANVHTLIPPGVNAHTFEPNPASIKSILESNIYFRVGDIFHMEEVIFNKIDCSQNINIINNDPHYWTSPDNVKIISKTILTEVINKFPEQENYFRKNRINFINKIDSIDLDISNRLKDKKIRSLLVYHPAWQYLANRYDLKQISIERDGKSPKAKDLQKFIELAKVQNANCVFFDPHFDYSSVSTVAKSIDIKIDALNPLPTNYAENLISIGNKLEYYLR